jgi:hypothetical protein
MQFFIFKIRIFLRRRAALSSRQMRSARGGLARFPSGGDHVHAAVTRVDPVSLPRYAREAMLDRIGRPPDT